MLHKTKESTITSHGTFLFIFKFNFLLVVYNIYIGDTL
jgi:hypothetical protein